MNRRTSFVGERSASKRRRLERNSSCSLEKLNFTALSRVRIGARGGRLLPPAHRDGPIAAQFPDVFLIGRQHGNRGRPPIPTAPRSFPFSDIFRNFFKALFQNDSDIENRRPSSHVLGTLNILRSL